MMSLVDSADKKLAMPAITIEQFNRIVEKSIPFAKIMNLQLDVISDREVVMRAIYSDDFLRPGGTISGPVMMGLADAAIYALVLSKIGLVELAVTTSLNINFLSKPQPGDILARAHAQIG